MPTSRRGFLKTSLVAAGGLFLAGCRMQYKPRPRTATVPARGANDRIRVAVAGLNNRGEEHLKSFTTIPNVQVAAIVDPDSRLFAPRAKLVENKGLPTPHAVQDVRRVLDDKSIDVVSIATPNHWHSLMTIWACQAGKDVYVEKPLSHNIHEGRIAVEAARRGARIVQHGTQTRSNLWRAKTLAVIASGQLGKLLVSRGVCYKPRPSIGCKPPTHPPPELDYDLWLGPAPDRPYHENLVHYNWHWFWEFGNGDIGNQGVHEMDVARWAIPGAAWPRSAVSLGGRFGYQDQGQTPNTQIAIFDYGQTLLVFEVRGLPTDKYHGQTVGNTFHLEAGSIYGGDFYPKGSKEPQPLPDVPGTLGPGGGDHFANFIVAVRSRRVPDLNADVLQGHYSSALCHLANISYRLGQQVPFNPRTGAFGDNTEAYETLARMQEHLAGENALPLHRMMYRLGRKLVVDASRDRIVGDDQANVMLTREYRRPFVVPDKMV